jgi:hypothetical protein
MRPGDVVRCLVIVLLAVGSPGAQGSAQRGSLSIPTATRDSIMRVMKELASAISTRDADASARYIREDHHAVYVSDGHLIRGTAYRQTLRKFYEGLRRFGMHSGTCF